MPDQLVNAKDGTVLVLVPESAFIMGSELFDESPQHEHYLSNYYISLYPISNHQFERFVLATGYNESDEWREFAGPGKEHHPVVKVNWYDARTYCEWAGLRLPTEPEWEKGCRGEGSREYPWGDEWDPGFCRNSVEDDEEQGTSSVESFEQGASSFGLIQMSGNIWEWCSNCYQEDLYKSFARGDYSVPMEGGQGVLRGGGWEDVDEFFYRCSTRLANARTLRHRQAGFRPARDFTV